MAKKQTTIASTQEFTEIWDIVGNILFFKSGNACLVMEVASSNFALLSLEEQEIRVSAYASFLNSLSFPIQLVVSTRRVDVSAYITLLDTEVARAQQTKAGEYMTHYRDFVQQLVKQNVVLDKKFYIAIPFSSLEAGPAGVFSKSQKEVKPELVNSATAALTTKADEIKTQLRRMNLQTKTVDKDALISVFHALYHHPIPTQSMTAETHTDIEKGGAV